MLISKNVNNDVTKDSPLHIQIFDCVLDRSKLLGLVLLLCAAEYNVKNYVNRGGG